MWDGHVLAALLQKPKPPTLQLLARAGNHPSHAHDKPKGRQIKIQIVEDTKPASQTVSFLVSIGSTRNIVHNRLLSRIRRRAIGHEPFLHS